MHTMRTFKIILFPTLALLIYILLLGTVFFWSSSIAEIGTTISLQIILLIFLHFAVIPLNRKTLITLSRWTAWRWTLLALLSLFFLTPQHSIFLFLTHMSLAIYFFFWHYNIQSTKKRYYRSTSHQWLSLMAIMLAITYTSTIWIAGAAVNLNCNSLKEQSIWFLNNFIPSLDSNSWIIQWLNNLDTLWSQSIGQILGTQDQWSWSQLTIALQSQTWDQLLLSWNNWNMKSWLLWNILSYQEKVINWFITNQNIINSQVCDITLQQINNLAQNNDVQLIVFISFVLLLYVFMNTITFVIGLINYIILIILFKTWWFIRKHHKDTVEEVTI